jgi:hypothetical protein
MQETVIVLTHQRPELLYCCLDAIRTASPDISIHVFPDRGTSEIAICKEFEAVHHLTFQHSYHGNSFNMLEALKWANERIYQIVYVIEDDAIIDSTFFNWARQALKNYPDAFAACGWQYSPDALPSDGPDMLLDWYLSVAAALPRRSVAGIVQHARPEYYSNMKGYLDRAYPGSQRRGSMHYEQDGLALRVAGSENRRCVWPRRPRVTHIGWRGYHMPDGQEIPGTLEEKVAIIKLAVNNPEILTLMMQTGKVPEIRYCQCRKPLLSTNKLGKIICIECFHTAHPHLPVVSASHYYLGTE